MNEEEKNLAIYAIGAYIDAICAGDVDGDDHDIEVLTNVIIKIKNQ